MQWCCRWFWCSEDGEEDDDDEGEVEDDDDADSGEEDDDAIDDDPGRWWTAFKCKPSRLTWALHQDGKVAEKFKKWEYIICCK